MKDKKKKETQKNDDPIKYIITGQTPIMDLIDNYPQVVEFLIDEYAFHCMNCLLAELEDLESGAASHGIQGEDFERLLFEVNMLVD